MIVEIITQLQSGNWYGCSDFIELAKGKNEIPKSWQEAKEKMKRIRYMQTSETGKGLNKFSFLKKLDKWLLRSR